MPRLPADQSWRLRRGKTLIEVHPGFFRMRLVRGGPWVPASIWVQCPMVVPDMPAALHVNATPCDRCQAGMGLPHAPQCPWSMVEDPEDWCRPHPHRRLAGTQPWTVYAEINGAPADPARVWERGYRIGARHYHHMTALRERAVAHAPHEPEANPHQAIDLRQQPSLF